MAANFSTKLIQDMLDSVGFRGAFANGVLDFYTGARPLSADSAATGTFLVRITLNGGAFTAGAATNGLNFGPASGNLVAKPSADVWRGVGVAAGTIGWARFKGNALDADQNTVALPRMDLVVGVSGADLNMSNLTVAVGSPHTVDIFEVAM